MGWIEDTETQIAESLAKMAKDGSVPAASAVLKLLSEKREASASDEHRAKIDRLSSDPPALCRYLGELGQPPAAVAGFIGSQMNEAETKEYRAGKTYRALEIKAIELARVRGGSGKIEAWMKT